MEQCKLYTKRKKLLLEVDSIRTREYKTKQKKHLLTGWHLWRDFWHQHPRYDEYLNIPCICRKVDHPQYQERIQKQDVFDYERPT